MILLLIGNPAKSAEKSELDNFLSGVLSPSLQKSDFHDTLLCKTLMHCSPKAGHWNNRFEDRKKRLIYSQLSKS